MAERKMQERRKAGMERHIYIPGGERESGNFESIVEGPGITTKGRGDLWWTGKSGVAHDCFRG